MIRSAFAGEATCLRRYARCSGKLRGVVWKPYVKTCKDVQDTLQVLMRVDREDSDTPARQDRCQAERTLSLFVIT